VLLAEDHEELAETVARVLRREGMAVDVALDGEEALLRAGVNDYDVVLLDRDLPGVHGDQVCRELAVAGATSRILMLTAAAAIQDRVDGLGLGADDYLPKPFAMAELIARIRALGRRGGTPLPAELVAGDLRLDPARRVAVRGGERLRVEASLAPARTVGDGDLAGRLIANLLDNALRYNIPGGLIEVSTSTHATEVMVRVGNTGPAVPASEVSELFQPFRRLGNKRTRHDDSHGLGLSIVSAIATAHHAAVKASARPGGGIDIEVRFPAVPAATERAR